MKGMLGGRYFPSLYGILSGIGIVLYAGKSVTSSPEGEREDSVGLRTWGGGMRGSLRWASPSTSTLLMRWYLAALRKIEAIVNKTIYQFHSPLVDKPKNIDCPSSI